MSIKLGSKDISTTVKKINTSVTGSAVWCTDALYNRQAAAFCVHVFCEEHLCFVVKHLNGQIHFKIFSTYCYTNFEALIFDFKVCFVVIILLMSYHQQFQISFFLHYNSQLHVFVFLRSPTGLRLYLGLAPQLICLPAVSASRHLQRSGV